jgi:hypothetical protein
MKTILRDLSSPAFLNPWHDFWLTIKPASAFLKRICIRDLIDQSTGEWNTQFLISLFDFHMTLYIAISFPMGSLIGWFSLR